MNPTSSRPRYEIADVIRMAGQRFLKTHSLPSEHHRVLNAITCCRTAWLGGHVEKCLECHRERIAYNSCRNRHCPKCQSAQRQAWVLEREKELLPVPYFHLVFTIPHQLSSLALQNPREIYGILLRASSETLKDVAANPKNLGARIGFLSVLHTWGQTLMHHPHVHCIVPAGGLALDGTKWIAGKKEFFLPVKVLSRVFRGKFVDLLKRAYRSGKLSFHGNLKAIATPQQFHAFLNRTVRRPWVVYAKRPFGGPQQVLRYLARYTHRVAISNSRLVDCNEQSVTFRWKNYAAGGEQQVMSLDAVEFLRRFLMHVLPKGFQKIRQYGFLCNRYRKQHLQKCRELLNAAQEAESSKTTDLPVPECPLEKRCCSRCGSGKIQRFDIPVMSGASVPAPHIAVQSQRLRPANSNPDTS